MNQTLIQKLERYLPPKHALPISESICVSIAEKGYHRCAAALQNAVFAEIRLGKAGLDELEIRRLFSLGKKLIATSRTNKVLLAHAVLCHAPLIDVEIDACHRNQLITAAKKQGSKVIVSHHDYEKTPSKSELAEIKKQCFDAGGDIAKIACMAHTDEDCDALLSFADPSTVVFGMGDFASHTRIASLFLGSPFAYAALDCGKETAPGQLTKAQIGEILARLSL
ncbi:type I 3-dehydroquinate dehydratase [Candidatus Micrarchaeota archaeon]|nr:type I 3-dehydroquinate dehydratase [Candidatus Micrarchaeota archaeon]